MTKKTPQLISTTPSGKGWPTHEVNIDDLEAATKAFEDASRAMIAAPRQKAIEAGQKLLVLYHEQKKKITGLTETAAAVALQLQDVTRQLSEKTSEATSHYRDWRDAETDLVVLKKHCLAAGLALPEGMSPPEEAAPQDDPSSEEAISTT